MSRSIILTPLILGLSGCSAMFYGVKGKYEHDRTGCLKTADGGRHRCRFLTVAPMRSEQQYLEVQHRLVRFSPASDTQTGPGKFMLMEYTPLGLISPLFGYPRKEETFSGKLKLRIVVPEAKEEYFRRSDYREFDIRDGRKALVRVDLNRGLQDSLEEKGRGTEYEPGEVTVEINCDRKKRLCSAKAIPPIIRDDGAVEVKAKEVTDEAVLFRLKQEKEEHRRREVEEIKRLEEQARRRHREQEADRARKRKMERELQAEKPVIGETVSRYMDANFKGDFKMQWLLMAPEEQVRIGPREKWITHMRIGRARTPYKFGRDLGLEDMSVEFLSGDSDRAMVRCISTLFFTAKPQRKIRQAVTLKLVKMNGIWRVRGVTTNKPLR